MNKKKLITIFTFLTVFFCLAFYFIASRRVSPNIKAEISKRTTELPEAITLDINVANGCEVGDANVIQSKMNLLKTNSLLVTIEDVGKKFAPVAAVSLNNSDGYLRSSTVDLSLRSIPTDLRDFALLVCSDIQNTGRCLGKTWLNMKTEADIEYDKLLTTKTSTLKKTTSDAIFYFQYLQIEDGLISTVSANNFEKAEESLKKEVRDAANLKNITDAIKNSTSLPTSLLNLSKKVTMLASFKKFDKDFCDNATNLMHQRKIDFSRRMRTDGSTWLNKSK